MNEDRVSCYTCKEIKPICEYRINRTKYKTKSGIKTKSYRRNSCSSCEDVKSKQRYLKNKHKIILKKKEREANIKDKLLSTFDFDLNGEFSLKEKKIIVKILKEKLKI